MVQNIAGSVNQDNGGYGALSLLGFDYKKRWITITSYQDNAVPFNNLNQEIRAVLEAWGKIPWLKEQSLIGLLPCW